MTNLNVAYMDAEDETTFTAGVNSPWHGFELGYIYAHNKIDSFNTADFIANCDDNCWIADPGSYDIHTIHASYLFPNVMNMKNFNIYLGAYASWIESSQTTATAGRLPAMAAGCASSISSEQRQSLHSAGSVLFNRLSLRGVARETSVSRESTLQTGAFNANNRPQISKVSGCF